MTSIHKIFRLIRLYNNIKSKDFADKLGISRSYLSEIEKGNRGISIKFLDKFAKTTELSVWFILFCREDYIIDSNWFAQLSTKEKHLYTWIKEKESTLEG